MRQSKPQHRSRHLGMADLAARLAVALVLALGGAATPAQAQEFSEAELFLELNDTDGDLGIHASIDGGPYVKLEIEDPQGSTILRVTASGRLAKQGLTQLFLESAEPSFDELSPSQFFKRFPEGRYEIEAVTADGQEIEAIARLSHVLAAPPKATVNGQTAAASCDDPLPQVSAPVVIAWDPVTQSHPTIGKKGNVVIVRYQVFVEQGDLTLGIDLPPDVTEFEVPAAITAAGGEFKFEIIARTTAGNNTAVESCYVVQ